jgi:hypothetical protein
MMKAVVLDITDGEATVMTKAGDIIGVSNRNYDIGQEIMVDDKADRVISFASKITRFMPAIAAAAAIIIMISTGGYAYYKPYGTVSLDVNPSIEYTINRFDRVLDVNGVNDDGNDIVSQLDVKKLINKDIEAAVEETIEQIEAEGYLSDEDGNYVVVTANTKKEEHTDKLVDKLDEKISGHKNLNPIASKVTDDDIKEAHEQGVSAGKKMIVDRLDSVSDKDIDRGEWNSRSVKDIMGEYDRLQRGDSVPEHEEDTRQFDDTAVPDGSDSRQKNDRAPVDENDSQKGNQSERSEWKERNTTGQEAPDNKDGSEKRQDNRPSESIPAENGQLENNDKPSGNTPSMETDKPSDNGNNMGGQPAPGGNTGFQEPPMQQESPGNSEPPMMQDPGNSQMPSEPGDQTPPQEHGGPGGGQEPPHGGR